MNLLVLLALLLAIAGWALTGMTFMHLLSGHFEERACQTDCVQTLYYAAVAAGFGGLLLSLTGLFRSQGRVLGVITFLLAFALCAVFAVLYITGNYI